MWKSKGRTVAILAGCVVVVVIAAAAWPARKHIRFWWEFESLGNNKQGYPEYRHRQTGIVFVKLPGGTFAMGTSDEEAAKLLSLVSKGDKRSLETHLPWEKPRHKVTLSPFMIAKFEVSNAEWTKVMRSNPPEFKGDTLPVENVSWDDCRRFCGRAGFCLPTEAQWEYACRAGREGTHASIIELIMMGWFRGNSGFKFHPVGQLAPNNFGLHDMQGNVWEWCEDAFDEDFYSKPEASVQDPLCKSGPDGRVLRGGIVGSSALECRFTNRMFSRPSSREGGLGFRPVWSPSP